jgi:hypothetical protein
MSDERAEAVKRVTDEAKRLGVDGWVNALIGLGRKNYDKSLGGSFELSEVLSEDLLTQLYIGDGLAKKIIDSIADDATRRWFSVDGDVDGKVELELERIGLQNAVNRAIKWQRLYGGSLIVMGLRDGMDLNRPVARTIRGIDWLRVYSAAETQITLADLSMDQKSPYFDDVEVYRIFPTAREPIEVHHSRCLVFKGDPLPRDQISRSLELDSWYWGLSEVQPIWRRLSHFGQIEQGVVNILLEFVLSIYKLSNLRELLAEGNDAALYRRMDIIQASKSIINGVLLGEDEDFSRNMATVAGVSDVLDRFMMLISGISGIPVTRLFGRSPAGENATGESDLTNYYDEVASLQRNWLTPSIMPAIRYVNSYAANIPDSDLSIEWRALQEPTEKETLEMRGKQAEIDERYINLGVMDSAEVRELRIEGGYSFKMEVEGE